MSESKINQNDGGGEHEADYPGVDLAEDVDCLGIFVVVQAESLDTITKKMRYMMAM